MASAVPAGLSALAATACGAPAPKSVNRRRPPSQIRRLKAADASAISQGFLSKLTRFPDFDFIDNCFRSHAAGGAIRNDEIADDGRGRQGQNHVDLFLRGSG